MQPKILGIRLAFLLPLTGQATKKENPIQDNSCLVKEAYNQATGVVQPMTTWQQNRDTKEGMATFTQEWPVGSLAHPFSFTLPSQHLLADPLTRSYQNGFGDGALNYRYQLSGDGDAKLAISARFSVNLPPGNERKERKRGAASCEFQFLLSWVMADQRVARANANSFSVPGSKGPSETKADLSGWGVGQSLIWLAHPQFKVMLEGIYPEDQMVAGPSPTARERWPFSTRASVGPTTSQVVCRSCQGSLSPLRSAHPKEGVASSFTSVSNFPSATTLDPESHP